MAVAHTSAQAFDSLGVRNYLQPKEAALMAQFVGAVAYTREQLAIRLGWKESAVCGRCNSLVAKGELEEIDGGKTSSGRSAKLLRLPRGPQKELFQAA